MPESDDEEPEDVIPAEVEIPIEDRIDLHFFSPEDIPAVVESYLEAARAAGFAEVRLIHGRGIGVQRAIVRRILANHPDVARFFDSTPDRGGWGATIVVFRHSSV